MNGFRTFYPENCSSQNGLLKYGYVVGKEITCASI